MKRCKHIEADGYHHCSSYAFNLEKDGIEQGDLCDVHYWQDQALNDRAAEREACAKLVEEFARKWWKIHCDSNLHYSSTLKAHEDFCALQAAIRARSNT